MFNFLKGQINDLAQKYVEKPLQPLVTVDQIESALKLGSQSADTLNKVFFDLINEGDVRQQNTNKENRNDSAGQNKEDEQFGGGSLEIFMQSKLQMSHSQDEAQRKEEELKKILRNIDKVYLQEKTTESECIVLEINKLPKYSPLEHAQSRLLEIESQSQVIAEKLNDNCLKHYDNIEQGFKLIDQIFKTNSTQLQAIQLARATLGTNKQAYVQRSLHAISLHKRIQKIKSVVSQLSILRDKFGDLSSKVTNLDKEGYLQDAATVIPRLNLAKQELLAEKQKDKEGANLLEQFHCLEHIDVFIDQKIDLFKKCILSSSEKIIFSYTAEKYIALMRSYFYLLKSFPDEIKPFPTLFLANINLYIDSVIRDAYDQFKQEAGLFVSEQEDKRFNLSAILPQISKDQFLLFIRICLHRYCQFMVGFQNCISFHLQFDASRDANLRISNSNDRKNQEIREFQDYLDQIKSTLLSNKVLFWNEMQRKISLILESSAQITHFSLQSMRELLEFVNAFAGIGESFSNAPSDIYPSGIVSLLSLLSLQSAIQEKCQHYALHFHKTGQVSLISTMHGESWRRLPTNQPFQFSFIKQGFSKGIANIARMMPNYVYHPIELNDERRIFDHSISSFKSENPFKITEGNSSNNSIESRVRAASYFRKFNKKVLRNDEIIPESHINQSIGEESKNQPDLAQNLISFESIFLEAYPKKEVVLCASTQIAFKTINEHLELIDAIRPVTGFIVDLIYDNLNFYVYFVVSAFLDGQKSAQLLEKLVLQGISKLDDASQLDNHVAKFAAVAASLRLQQENSTLAKLYLEINSECCARIKKLLPPTQLSLQKQFRGISERIIALEAFEYLLFNLSFVENIIQRMNGEMTLQFERKKYTQILKELKTIVFTDFAPQFARCDQIFSSMPQSKWDISESEASIPSYYVERFCSILADYTEQLQSAGGGSVPIEVQEEIFNLIISYCFTQLIDAISKIKKINEFGRKKLCNDFKIIAGKVSSLMKNKTEEQIQRSHVEDYLAMSQSNDLDEVQTFISFNKERYSLEALVGLAKISAAGQSLSRTKQKDLIVSILNDYKKYFIEQDVNVPF